MNKKGGAGSLPHLQIIVIYPESPGVLGADTHLVVSTPLIISYAENGVVASSNADSFTIHCVCDSSLRDRDSLSHPEGQ